MVLAFNLKELHYSQRIGAWRSGGSPCYISPTNVLKINRITMVQMMYFSRHFAKPILYVRPSFGCVTIT